MSPSRRERITITLRKDLLPLIDDRIDGRNIRNRSHAIESILDERLRNTISDALVLAGGDGINMRPFTYEMPKAMIPLHGKPILEYVINQLRENGFRHITIVVGHLGEQIEKHFGNGDSYGVQINYLKEKHAEGTAAAVRLARKTFNTTFLLMYGDVLVDLNLRDLMNFHKKYGGTATAAVTTTDDPSEYGSLRLHGSTIVEYQEKPKKNPRISHLVSAGMYAMEPEIFKYIAPEAKSLEQEVFPQLMKEKKLLGYPFEGQWFDISTPETYERAREEWKR